MYAQVVIETKTDYIDSLFTYEADDSVKVGDIVKVSFGKGAALKKAYVVAVSEDSPIEGDCGVPETDTDAEPPKNKKIRIKKISEKFEEYSLNPEIIDTAMFMRRRYLCRMIDAIECFLPAGTASKRGKIRRPLQGSEEEIQQISELTAEQQAALEAILPAITAGGKAGDGAQAGNTASDRLFLIHGVTGSGKTEVYMQLIARVLEEGRTAMMLVPEISLTNQIVERFFGRFGREKVAVLHSKLSAGERYDEWQRIRRGEASIVIGARSAVFAPLDNIGLIVMDEEHETSYKSDKSPKYETVEIAIKRLKAFEGTLVLGSATPSVVSYQRAQEGIYRLIEMKERYNAVPLPMVKTVDMRQELRKGNRSILSYELSAETERCISEGRQTIFFLNRRGYSTFISCRDCGYVLKCPDCEISLTYHKSDGAAVCHYCGRKISIPKECPECKGKHIRHFGTGTEKVEEYIKERFPGVGVDRLDLDAIKTKGALNKILGDFKKGKTQILIGTQLVAKGLDFKNVGLVGIISADVSLNIPDFRSAERTFQLITQAAGRAGRGDSRGRVIIQTYTPEHFAVQTAAAQDYAKFFAQENRMRRLLAYPPYCDLCQLMFVSPDESVAEGTCSWAYKKLKESLKKSEQNLVFKPQPAPVKMESGKYRYQLLVKIPKGKRSDMAQHIATLKKIITEDKRNKKTDYTMLIDFNPYSLV